MTKGVGAKKEVVEDRVRRKAKKMLGPRKRPKLLKTTIHNPMRLPLKKVLRRPTPIIW